MEDVHIAVNILQDMRGSGEPKQGPRQAKTAI